MELCELNVELRPDQGSAAVRRLRRAGKVPAVIYGEGKDAVQLVLDAHEFRLLARKAIPTSLFRFKSSAASIDGQMALVKDVQTEPIKDNILHVDFLAVSEGHRVVVSVPVKIIGESVAVKEGRAVLNQTAYEIELECLPTAIPESIEVSISSLNEGDSIHARDLSIPEGSELKSSRTLTIVSAVHLKKEEAKTEVTEAGQVPAAKASTGADKPSK